MGEIFLGDNIPGSFKTIYETNYKEVFFDSNSKIILTSWNEQSAYITDDEYKKDAVNNVQLIKKYKAINILADNRGNRFQITADVQRWYKESVTPLIGDHKMNKWAIVVMDDNLLLHNLLDEAATRALKMPSQKKANVRFFSALDEAFKWLRK